MNWDFQYWNTMSEAQQSAFLASWTGALKSAYEWNKTTITYSFPSIATGHEHMPYVPAGQPLMFQPLDPEEKAFVRFVFAYLESFLNLDFQEVLGAAGDIVLGQHNMSPAGYADLPSNFSQSGVFIDTTLSSAEFGDFSYTTLVHEIGHALGLSHTRAYGEGGRFNPQLPVQFDTTLMSIMSYSDMAMLAPFRVVGSFMPLDIAALMEMYGARASSQDNVFRVVDGHAIPSQSGPAWTVSGNIPFTLVDTGGFDVLDASAYTNTAGVQFIFDEGLWLQPGNPFNQLSYYNGSDRPWVNLAGQTDMVPMIGIYQATVIEKFVGTSANDHVYGNSFGQAADGGGGIDTFYLSGTSASGYTFTVETGSGHVIVADINPADGNDGVDRLINFELVSFVGHAPVTIQSLLDPVLWYESRDDVTTVAATWQLMMTMIPKAQGFEYLISSPANPTDLNDPYYAAFNVENTYLNFASNLAFENPQGHAWYETQYGSLTFAQAVDKAVDAILASGASAGAKGFFLGAEAYYAEAALERIVRPGVSLEDATKVAMLSSVLFESVKSDAGPFGHAVNDFADEVSSAGLSDSFGESLFA